MPSEWTTTTATASVWRGRYSDGRTAASRTVDVWFDAGGLRLSADGWSEVWPYSEIATAVPINDASSDVLVLAKSVGTTLFVGDRGFTQQLAGRAPHVRQRAFRMAALKAAGPVGLAAVALGGAIMAFDLSPSKAVAKLMPDAAREQLGRSVLVSLPVKQTCRSNDGSAALAALVKRLRPGQGDKPVRVDVLNWSLVNAFALPGGNVVLTRAIIERAASADEIAGVLAHEMGHAIELHPEAGLVRSVGFWALIQMVFTGTPGAVGNVGNLLAQLAYTRGYEREADLIALRLLKEAKISHRGFAGFFKRMDGGKREGKQSPSSRGRGRFFGNDVFDTHPSTPERIAVIDNTPDYDATPALTGEEWLALKQICGAAGPVAGGVPGTPRPPAEAKPKTTDPEAALKEADARIAAAPADALGYLARGNLHQTARRYDAAIVDYSKAIELQAGNANFHYQRGRAYQNARRHDEAIADYSEAARINPRHSMALAARGATHRLKQNAATALTDFDAALAINPRNTYALYQRGLLFGTLARWMESERDFSKVIEGNKGYAFAFVRRGQAYEAMRRRDEAIADYRAALGASPGSADAATAFRLARERLTALGVANP